MNKVAIIIIIVRTRSVREKRARITSRERTRIHHRPWGKTRCDEGTNSSTADVTTLEEKSWGDFHALSSPLGNE